METNNIQAIALPTRRLTKEEKKMLIDYLTRQVENDCTPRQMIMLIAKVYNKEI